MVNELSLDIWLPRNPTKTFKLFWRQIVPWDKWTCVLQPTDMIRHKTITSPPNTGCQVEWNPEDNRGKRNIWRGRETQRTKRSKRRNNPTSYATNIWFQWDVYLISIKQSLSENALHNLLLKQAFSLSKPNSKIYGEIHIYFSCNNFLNVD